MLSEEQAGFFNRMVKEPVGKVDEEALFSASLEILFDETKLLYGAIDIVDACVDPKFQTSIKCVSLEEAGTVEPHKMRRFWIVTTDLHTIDDTGNAVSGSRAKQFHVEEHLCLLSGCSCQAYVNMLKAKSGKIPMCEHLLAVRLSTQLGGDFIKHELVGREKFTEQMHFFSAQQICKPTGGGGGGARATTFTT